ncbi:MAG: hypothetical protein ABSC08_20290 [Bryobacteraceae bacterium]
MEPETQKKILDAGNRFLAEVCEASDSKVKNYEEMNEFVRLKIHEYGNKTLSALLLDWVRKQLPSDNNDQLLKPENLELYLTAMDTREKAEFVARCEAIAALSGWSSQGIGWGLEAASDPR